MKIRIQTRSSSGHLKRLLVQSWESKSTRSSKHSKIRPSQLRSFKNFGGGSVGCLKITEDKSSDTDLTQTHIFSSNANLLSNDERGYESAPHSNSNAKAQPSSRLNLSTPAKPAFQL